LFAQGGLTPPGAPTPTMKTLDQIEPRTPVSAENTPGDTTTLFKITQPGSYYLTGNVTGVSNKHGIVIACTNVTLDLMGFDLNGGGYYSRSAVTVSGAQRHIAVINGAVHDWGEGGVDTSTAEQCSIEGIRATAVGGPNYNMRSGIHTGDASTVSRCFARNNGFGGFKLGAGCVISDCTALLNAAGFEIGAGATVSRCTAWGNSGLGISVAADSVLMGCTATSNSNNGIVLSGGTARDCSSARNALRGFYIGSGSTVTGCSANNNTSDGFYFSGSGCAISGCSAQGNGGDGINIGGNSLVSGNTCHLNNGAGIRPSGNARVDGNLVCSNNVGVICTMNGNNFVVRNTAHGNTLTDYSIAAGNQNAAVVANPGANFANQTPWSNFQY
jgi:parallel beta-helix repeat protein